MSGNSQRPHNKKVYAKTGFMLDIGCGGNYHRPGYVRLDKDKRMNPDICHNLEKFPYPIKSGSVTRIVAYHIIEHIKPWLMVDLMNELWRIAIVDCQLAIAMPYGYSSGFLQDPTHCNPHNEFTWQYFDPSFELWTVYKPKPWQLEFFAMQHNGNMEVILKKIKFPKPANKKKLLKQSQSIGKGSSSEFQRQVLFG